MSQGISQHIAFTIVAKQSFGAGTHDACTLQFQVEVVIDFAVVVIDTTRTLTQFLDELKVLRVHWALNMQQAHLFHHASGHLLLKGAGIVQAHFNDVAIGVGAAVTVTVTLVTTATILCCGRHHGCHSEQQHHQAFQQLSGFHIQILCLDWFLDRKFMNYSRQEQIIFHNQPLLHELQQGLKYFTLLSPIT